MKVRFVLSEKKLNWTSHEIRTYKFDHYQPEYQSIHPHSLVPAIKHDGHAIIHSGVIAEYLDEAFPDPPLSPSSALDRAKMREWMREEEEFLFRLIVTMSFNIMMKLRAQAFGLEQLKEWSKRHPDTERANDYLQRVTSPADLDAVAQAEKKLRWHMERFEAQLKGSGGPWVIGELFTLADICLAPILDRVEYLDKAYLWRNLPRVTDWYERVKQRPSFLEAAPSFENRMWGPKKPVTAES